MAIAEGIAAAKLALDASREALDLLRYPKIDGEQVRNKLTEMQDLVFSAQRALGEAEDENRQLRRQLDDREALQQLDAEMDFVEDGRFYVRKSESDKGVFIPYCLVCWKKDNKTVPLSQLDPDGYYRCIHDESIYRTKRYIDSRSGKPTSAQRSPRSGYAPFG